MKSIKFNKVNGTIIAPPSKSDSIRAIALSVISTGNTIISNLSGSDDTLSALNIAESIGASIAVSNNQVELRGIEYPSTNRIECNESALCLRLFMPIMLSYGGDYIFSGKGTLLKRHQSDIIKKFSAFDVECFTQDSLLPIRVYGKLVSDEYTLDCSDSSQLLSGFLFAFSRINGITKIHAKNLVSNPYVDMTVNLLKKAGITISVNDNLYTIVGKENIKPIENTIEGDWSAMSTFIIAAAISGTITIKGLSCNPSVHADQIIIDIVKGCGADVNCQDDSITISSNHLTAFDFDATNCPDLIPGLCILALNCSGTSRITGIDRLIHKESNRLQAIYENFQNAGVNFTINNNTVEITKSQFKPLKPINTFSDHRIAMAFSIAAMNSTEEVIIDNQKCVAKSYPDFWNDLESVI